MIASASFAADPAGFNIWRAGELKGFEKSLAPKMNKQKVATQNLSSYGNHLAMVAHREGNGEAELHQSMADVFVAQSGEATLVVGGKIPSPRNTAPGEVRGASIEGGTKHKLAAGDIVHIPANVPHQLLLDNGTQFTYFVVKVDTK